MKAVMLLLLLLAGCAADPAGSCMLSRAAELPLTMMGNVPLVDVDINGRPARMLLDTGSDATVLGPAAAARLGAAPGGPPRVLRGAGGTTTAQMATLQAVSLGGATTRNVRAMVTDALGPPIDGILGINVLVGFELDLDVPQRRLVLYRARPCAAALPPWSGPYTRLPVQQQRTGHLFVSAELDGQPVFGLLDTGASRTTMAVAVARDAGVTLRQLQAAPGGRSRTLDPGGLAFRQQQFRALRIGNDVLESPMLLVADLPPYAGEMIIGGDYLATRRVWMSLLTGMVFTTASAQPADQPRPR